MMMSQYEERVEFYRLQAHLWNVENLEDNGNFTTIIIEPDFDDALERSEAYWKAQNGDN